MRNNLEMATGHVTVLPELVESSKSREEAFASLCFSFLDHTIVFTALGTVVLVFTKTDANCVREGCRVTQLLGVAASLLCLTGGAADVAELQQNDLSWRRCLPK